MKNDINKGKIEIQKVNKGKIEIQKVNKGKIEMQKVNKGKIEIQKFDKEKIDWMITIVPFLSIFILSMLFFIFPRKSNKIIGDVRYFLGDNFGAYYLLIGLFIFFISIYIALSKYGNIVLGEKNEKPKYSFFTWGAMMFTCGLAADILFYSFSEWIMYATSPHVKEMGNIYTWSNVFSLFHWSFIPWAFYLVLAVSFGFMLHVRKRNRQRFSEACRPILKDKTDGFIGRFIDLLSVFALIAGTATTFSVATPLMAEAINSLFNVNLNRIFLTIIILLITCVIYTYSLLHGIKGIGMLANICIWLFFGLLLYVLLFTGETKFIIENGLESIGALIGNFVPMATFTDPTRKSSFPQNWTIYYWAYWMVWCVAAPFFIGSISRGRTVRETIIGGYVFGVGSTLISFIILGNYSMGKEVKGAVHFIEMYKENNDFYALIINIIKTMPLSYFVIVLLILTMIAFYATSFDSIALIASCYSYHKLDPNETPNKLIELMWCILLIVLPIALLFSESSMSNIQSISIIAAFPLAMVIVLITMSFLKDAKEYIKN